MKKRLRTISKNSAKAQKETEREDLALRQMESAALAAYSHDVANNADMTSMAINSRLTASTGKVWQEMKKDGKTTYWNSMTNGSNFVFLFNL